MRNKHRRPLVILMALFVCFGASLGVFAQATYEIPDMALTLEVPEDTYIFTPDISNNDVRWEEAGLGDPIRYKTEYQELGVVAHLSTNGGKTNVYINRKESDRTQYYYSLAAMTPTDLTEFVDQYTTKEGGSMTSTAEVYSHPQTPFVKTDIHSTFVQKNAGTVYEQMYFTIVNGYTVSFQTFSEGEIPPENLAFLKNLVDSVKFTKLLPKPQTAPEDVAKAWLVVGLFAAVLVGIIVALVVSKTRAKRRKNQMRQLADQISAYRSEKKTGTCDPGVLRFQNTTEHSDEVLRLFAKYQAYLRHPIAPVFTIVLTVAATVISLQLGGEWWMTLLLALAAAFCIYKFVVASYTIEKALKKVYGNMKSRQAKYMFRENEFTVSGMQRAEDYPYFQITELREYKNYFYLYFGENTTYFVDKEGFALGDAAGFKDFIAMKMKQKG